ncbi:MAG TPA: Wzz/FepE/Etk N-terminal domain-containing protein, partial [Bacteroidales bacterium]|nr:Wzz/FepE/Etk N-terminal domain-containing protein [Bacteroidales bacterium]
MKESTTPKELTFENTNFLFFLFKWRKLLIIICVAAAIISAGISLLIKNKYVSTVVIFPTSTNAVSKALISSQYGVKEDIMAFGEDEDAEQMLQILNSNEIRQRIIQKFNLLEHYDINPESKYRNTRLYETYNENISFNRTEYMAVEIKVTDKDPQMAADIANEIANLYDTVKNNLQKQRSLEGFKIVEGAVSMVQMALEQLSDKK